VIPFEAKQRGLTHHRRCSTMVGCRAVKLDGGRQEEG
jgi:hypothetical protein